MFIVFVDRLSFLFCFVFDFFLSRNLFFIFFACDFDNGDECWMKNLLKFSSFSFSIIPFSFFLSFSFVISLNEVPKVLKYNEVNTMHYGLFLGDLEIPLTEEINSNKNYCIVLFCFELPRESLMH